MGKLRLLCPWLLVWLRHCSGGGSLVNINGHLDPVAPASALLGRLRLAATTIILLSCVGVGVGRVAMVRTGCLGPGARDNTGERLHCCGGCAREPGGLRVAGGGARWLVGTLWCLHACEGMDMDVGNKGSLRGAFVVIIIVKHVVA